MVVTELKSILKSIFEGNIGVLNEKISGNIIQKIRPIHVIIQRIFG